MKTFAVRLTPGSDLKKQILELAVAHRIKAGCIVTCVGSLKQVHLRYANKKKGTLKKGHFEILSLTGTVSMESAHLHLSVSDGTGKVTGGHLLEGNLIYTTAEIVVGKLKGLRFERKIDTTYGYSELRVIQSKVKKN